MRNNARVPPLVRLGVEQVLQPDAVEKWWTTPMEKLAGFTPQQTWDAAPLAVYNVVAGYLDPPVFT